MKTNEEILKEMIGSCFSLDINLNDTFYYACADTEEICTEDFLDLLEVAKEHGTYNTITAYAAVKRELLNDEKNLSPIWLKRKDKKDYFAAKDKILNKVKEDNDLFVELSFDYNEKQKEESEFGEPIYWSSSKQNNLILQVASLPKKKIYGVGSCRYDAENDLRKKFKEKENELL